MQTEKKDIEKHFFYVIIGKELAQIKLDLHSILVSLEILNGDLLYLV